MSLWDKWLVKQPNRGNYTKFRHFEFEEDSSVRPVIQHELVTLVYDYHIRSRNGINLLPQLGYRQVAKAMRIDQRPSDSNPNTQKGHLIEILACDFAQSCLGYDIPIFRFHYNPNYEQSMKGDDLLGFDLSSGTNVIVGEAKYRKTFKKETVLEMYDTISNGFRPHPISIEFVASVLEIEGGAEGDAEKVQKAQKIRQLHKQLKSDSSLGQRNYLLFLATEGRPRKPFETIQNENNVLENLTAVNIVFQKDIDQWINNVYKQEIQIS